MNEALLLSALGRAKTGPDLSAELTAEIESKLAATEIR